METEEKSGQGLTCTCGEPYPCKNVARNPKIVSHPALCHYCTGEYSTLSEGPDAGVKFACNIMVENMNAGNYSFSCPYFQKKEIAAIIDAEKEQEKAHIGRLLAQGKKYQETGNRFYFVGRF